MGPALGGRIQLSSGSVNHRGGMCTTLHHDVVRAVGQKVKTRFQRSRYRYQPILEAEALLASVSGRGVGTEPNASARREHAMLMSDRVDGDMCALPTATLQMACTAGPPSAA